MESYRHLLDAALILLDTKVFELLTRRIEMPQAVGALATGLLLGPACFSTVQESEFLDHIAEIGVIVLMFSAGLETDISELKESGRNSFVIAVIGILIPLIAGYMLASFFDTEPTAFLQSMLIGVVLTATSVNISVKTLKEMGELSIPSDNTILGAALIDDTLRIVASAIITGMADTSVQLTEVMLEIVAFFVLAVVVGIFARRGIEKLFSRYQKVHRRFPILSFAFCLLFAYVAGALFGVAGITGAFIAGLIVSSTSRCNYVQMRIEALSYLLISPVFFASIGLKVMLPEASTSIMIFSALLLVLAILTRIVDCSLGAKPCRCENIQSLRVGIGVVSHGEVAPIVVSRRMKASLMNKAFFDPIIIVVILTTVIAPVLLKIVFRDREDDPDVYASSEPIEDYERIERSEKLAQKVLEQD